MKKIWIPILAALAILVAAPAVGATEFVSKSAPSKVDMLCGGTVSCCDSPIADRVSLHKSRAMHALAPRGYSPRARALCGTIPDFPCGQWVYVGNGYYMYVPCRGG